MRRSSIQILLPLPAAVASDCVSLGTGPDTTPPDGHSTVFNWIGSDGISGTMSATMSGGLIYSGQYFQITNDTTIDGIRPLWYSGWGGRIGWSDWDYFGAHPSPDFITHNTGRVVARLAALNGTHMRCQFPLVHPADGMNGGGTGQCQLLRGTAIDANIPTAQYLGTA